MGDWGHSLRVMKSDGTDGRILIDRTDGPWHLSDLIWSPDGQRLMLAETSGDSRLGRVGPAILTA